MSFFSTLRDRGLIYQCTDEGIEKYLDGGARTLYCGFDPSSDSLHLGSLLPILMLRRFQLAGHRPLAIVGGATGMIGDPSGKSQERQLLDKEAVARNLEGIKSVISRFLDFEGSCSAQILNNNDWCGKVSYTDFLRDVGKHFSVNAMIAKESVSERLENRDQGISYTEFSYMLLQAYDFYILNRDFGCAMQVGGSDQWGNITAGCELIRRMAAASGRSAPAAFGVTFPLITKADGTKFGKSEKGNVWLDARYTSPYQFYQFLIQTADVDVMKLLRFLTFVDVETLASLEQSLAAAPERREAQRVLAREVTKLVHGDRELARVEHASQVFFGTDVGSLDRQTLLEICADVPNIVKSRNGDGIGLVELLVESGLCSSNGMARKEITGGGIYVNNVRISDPLQKLTEAHCIAGACILLRRGKKNYALIVLN